MAEFAIKMGILVIDDDPKICETLHKFMAARGHCVYTAHNGTDGIDILKKEQIDVVITDYQMPDIDGLEVLKQVKASAPETETIIITGHGDLDIAIDAMRAGAFDFFNKPLNIPDLVAALERTTRFYSLRTERNRYRDQLASLQDESKQAFGLNTIVGMSPAISKLKQQIQDISQVDTATILIRGETGTGKELVARAIHYESGRANHPFVAVDCTAIPEALAESELFGHEKGAFTDAHTSKKGRFEQATGGTLFLDEIGDMPLQLQSKFLRALEERSITPLGATKEVPIDVRVVSATNRDLLQAIADGTFREDLFYRLNTVLVEIPPLRERRQDILALAQFFFNRYQGELHKALRGFSFDAQTALQQYDFPGNIRELRNVIEQAVIFCKDQTIQIHDLKFQSTTELPTKPSNQIDETISNEPIAPIDMSTLSDLNLEMLERTAIIEALRRCDGNQHHAADLLGITRYALRRRMDRYKLK